MVILGDSVTLVTLANLMEIRVTLGIILLVSFFFLFWYIFVFIIFIIFVSLTDLERGIY